MSIFRGSDQRGPRTSGNLTTHDVVCVFQDCEEKQREETPGDASELMRITSHFPAGVPDNTALSSLRGCPALRLAAIFFPGFLQYKDLLRILISTFVEMENT